MSRGDTKPDQVAPLSDLSDALKSPWGKLRSHFLASLDPDERSHIYALSVKTSLALQRWAEHHPVIRPVRVPPLSLSVAAGAPFSPVGALISTARLSLWVFTLDDWFDEECAPELELRQQARDFQALVYQHIARRPDNSLAAPLSEVRDDLATYPLFKSLGGEWAAALCGTIESMLREYDWRVAYREAGSNTSNLPTYEQYLAVARYSIGGPPHMWAAMITANDPSTPEHLDHLRGMEQIASMCIRLANDLQSYQKEIGEGNINALVILSSDLMKSGVPADTALEQAKRRVHADIGEGLDRLSQLREAAVSHTGHPEATIDNIARFVCDFYAHHDYHTFVGQGA